MHTIRLAAPADAAAEHPTGKREASGEAGAGGFPAILSGVRRPGGEAVPDGNGRPVRLLAGELPGSETDVNGEGASALGIALLRHVTAGGEGGQGEERAGSRAAAKAKGKGESTPGTVVSIMPVRPEGGRAGAVRFVPGAFQENGSENGLQSGARGKEAGSSASGAGSGGAKRAQVSWGTLVPGSEVRGAEKGATDGRLLVVRRGNAGGQGGGDATRTQLTWSTFSGGEEGRGRQGAEGSTSTKEKTAKQMPKAGGAPQNGQSARPSSVREGTFFERGRSRPGSKAGAQSAVSSSNGEGPSRGEGGRSQGPGAQTATDRKHGQHASLLSTKRGTTDPGRRAEAVREATSDGRSSRSGRGGRSSGRQAQGQSGQQGGGHQKGGQQGHGGGQNGPNGAGTKARNPASPPSFSLSSSNASSGESDANTLRASLTREASTTGSGLQGTDGKGAGASGTTAGATGAKSSGRPGGGAGPPRTMPSAWINAAKQGPLRTAELAGGWKAMEMSLGEDKGTMTVKARQGSEHMAVSVGFSEARVQAQVVANARQIQDAMQAQYGTDVDLSFGGEGAGASDQEAMEGGGPDRSATLAPGETGAEEDEGGASPLRSRGRREWVG